MALAVVIFTVISTARSTALPTTKPMSPDENVLGSTHGNAHGHTHGHVDGNTHGLDYGSVRETSTDRSTETTTAIPTATSADTGWLTLLCFSNHGTNPNPKANRNPYEIPVEVPSNNITVAKWLEMSNGVYHYQRMAVAMDPCDDGGSTFRLKRALNDGAP